MIIETNNLTKRFKGKGGCKDISLSVYEGHVFGFLGPNGAGKSTFVKTLLGLLTEPTGEAFILGKPIGDVKVRSKIGYLPELFRFHDFLTAEQLLEYHAQLYGMDINEYRKRVAYLIDLVGLKGKEKQKIGTFSKGMQQRIGIAMALINDPKLVFLDEPTSALDPIGRKEVRDLIIKLKEEGKTVFLNSHLLSEVEAVSDDIGIINNSKLVIEGSLKDLQKREIHLDMIVNNYNHLIKEKLLDYSHDIVRNNDNLVVGLKEEKDVTKVLKIIIDNGGEIFKVDTKKKSLEDLFMSCIGQKGK